MAFGQSIGADIDSWGVAPGYGEKRPSANRQNSATYPPKNVDRKVGRPPNSRNATFSTGHACPGSSLANVLTRRVSFL